MAYNTLISTMDLHQHLDDPNWVIVDCRFDLQKPEWGRAGYLSAHIPGAVDAHLDQDLASPKTPNSGRHPLPAPQALSLIHISEPTRLGMISYAVFCLKKKKKK